ncbi:hypothetical protein HN451_04955 [archaeon]|nr:hypothetical protein [archaeon]
MIILINTTYAAKTTTYAQPASSSMPLFGNQDVTVMVAGPDSVASGLEIMVLGANKTLSVEPHQLQYAGAGGDFYFKKKKKKKKESKDVGRKKERVRKKGSKNSLYFEEITITSGMVEGYHADVAVHPDHPYASVDISNAVQVADQAENITVKAEGYQVTPYSLMASHGANRIRHDDSTQPYGIIGDAVAIGTQLEILNARQTSGGGKASEKDGFTKKGEKKKKKKKKKKP